MVESGTEPDATSGVPDAGDPVGARKVHQFPLVRSYMTPSTHTIAPSAPLSEGLAAMREADLRSIPVCADHEVAGILSLADAELALSLRREIPVVAAVMRSDLLQATPDAPLAEVVEELVGRKIGAAVIVEDGRCIGVFTAQDALVALRELLSEPD
jgi:CBS domain-containing protein